ncbi:MAG: PD40 domain-containing protein [Anaerolineae bacterium]|nr:PD40 domain-containing protein [Anaerolineae bacterium]
MNNLDQTFSPYEDRAALPYRLRRAPQLFTVFGYGLLLWAVLIIGCGPASILTREQASEAIAQATEPVEVPASTTPTLAPAATLAPENTAEPLAQDDTEGVRAGDSIPADSPVGPEPEIGQITFALGATELREPIDPDLLFTAGITQIHAIFDYSGMSTAYTWERVWYLNETEVARSATAWTGPESGTFDYFIDNGLKPLPAGDWLLEIYVEDKLQSLGVFIIEDVLPPAETAGSPAGVYQLVYPKCDGDHHDIYVADTNGRHEQLIVTRGAGPSWTPDGAMIFFFGEGGVDRQMRNGLEYVFDGISSGLVAMTAYPLPTGIEQLNMFQSLDWKQGTARWARVSPDGSMVAYDAKPGGDYRLYFLGTAANQQFRYEIPGEQADWSPDSRKIVYRSGRNGQVGIWISNRDDSDPTRLTENGTDSFPAWSPDGDTIAFSRDVEGNVDIYAINVDGSNLRRLTDAPGHDTLATYAPNGDLIFRSARTGSWGIWKMKGDGSGQTEIIANACVGNDWAYSMMDVLP